MTGTSS